MYSFPLTCSSTAAVVAPLFCAWRANTAFVLLCPPLFHPLFPQVLIFDEAHKLKRDTSQFVEVLKSSVTRGVTICLTGTPLQNNTVSEGAWAGRKQIEGERISGRYSPACIICCCSVQYSANSRPSLCSVCAICIQLRLVFARSACVGVQEEFFTLLNVCNNDLFGSKADFLQKFGEIKVRDGLVLLHIRIYVSNTTLYIIYRPIIKRLSTEVQGTFQYT